MKMFTFARHSAAVPPLIRPLARTPVEDAAVKPPPQAAAPLARSTDADGQLRRSRQVVEDNRLL